MPFSDAILPLDKTDRRVYGALEALVVLVALAYVSYAVHRYVTIGAVVGSDFPFFWVAAHIDSAETLHAAYSGELFSLDAARAHWGDAVEGKYFAYPPHFLLALRPLADLSYGAAFVVWSGVGLALFTLIVWATFERSWPSVRFALLAPAALFCLVLGQTGLIMSALLIGGIGWLWRRPVLAGICFGLLTFKPPLGLLVPFVLLAGGHWRTIASASLTAALLILASLAVYGVDAWEIYLTNLPGRQVSLQADFGGLIVNLSPTVTMAARLIGLAPAAQLALQALAASCALVGTVWAFRRDSAPGLSAAVLFIGTMLASPFSLSYDMSMVSVAVWLLLQDMQRGGPSASGRIIAVLTWTLPVWVYAFNEVHLPVGPPILAAAFALGVVRLSRGVESNLPRRRAAAGHRGKDSADRIPDATKRP